MTFISNGNKIFQNSHNFIRNIIKLTLDKEFAIKSNIALKNYG